MEKYFLIQDGTKNGPFSIDQIIEMNLDETTLVWKKGLKDWIKLLDLPEYKIYFPPSLPISIDKKSPILKDLNEDQFSNIPPSESYLESKISNNRLEDNNKIFGGFWIRLLAFFIDFLILFFITSFIWVILQIPVPNDSRTFISDRFFIFKNPVGILFGWLFYAFFESSKFQATPGKIILGLVITNENFLRIDFGKATGRFFSKIVSGIILGIGYIMIGLSKKKQGLHDKLMGTIILRQDASKRKYRSIAWTILLSTFLMFNVSLFIPANIPVNTSSNWTSETIIRELKNPVTSKMKVETLSFNYLGLSFNYPSNWKIEKLELQKDISYQINCENDAANGSEIMSITMLTISSDSYKMIQKAITAINKEPTHKNANIKPITPVIFNGLDAVSVEYDFVLLGEKFFGKMIALSSKDKTILILKQSDSLNKLETEFKTIENSFKIN